MRQQGYNLMNKLFRDRLDDVVSARLPAGSSDCRTLGLVLLHELLGEIRAIRLILEQAPTDCGTTQPSPALPVDVASASASVVKEVVAACEQSQVLDGLRAAEAGRAKPRKSVLEAIARRMDFLSEAHDEPI